MNAIRVNTYREAHPYGSTVAYEDFEELYCARCGNELSPDDWVIEDHGCGLCDIDYHYTEDMELDSPFMHAEAVYGYESNKPEYYAPTCLICAAECEKVYTMGNEAIGCENCLTIKEVADMVV